MKKFFLIATGIYLLVLSLIGLLVGAISFWMLQTQVEVLSSNMNPWVFLAYWVPLIIWLAASGIGLFRKRNWARYSILTISGFAIFMGTIFCIIFGMMRLPETEVASDIFNLTFKVVFLGLTVLFLIVLPIIYFIFFTRPSVKGMFQTRMQGQSQIDLERPVGISILAIFYLLSGILDLVLMVFPMVKNMSFLGIVISGWWLRIYQFVIAVLSSYIGYGFWRLKKAAWVAFLVLCSFATVNGVVNMFISDTGFFQRMNQEGSTYSFNPIIFYITAGLVMAVNIGLLIYVISKRTVFSKGHVNPAGQLPTEG